MPKRITFEQAEALLRSRDDVIGIGITDRQLRELVAIGTFIRVHRGFYVDGESWRGLWTEGRHLLRVIAHARSSPGGSPIATHSSAGALWGLIVTLELARASRGTTSTSPTMTSSNDTACAAPR